MVSDLTPHTYSIHWAILTSCYLSLTYNPTPEYDPTPGMPLYRVYPLRITLERFIFLQF